MKSDRMKIFSRRYSYCYINYFILVMYSNYFKKPMGKDDDIVGFIEIVIKMLIKKIG